ncbi:MAG: DNA primase [Bacilli bacterium]|nr:DNA primase [Bacilli bacterium]
MNTLSPEKINEIRNSVNIVDVISSYIPLTPKGKNYFGVCPFHDDTNPSMSVSTTRQIYKCFSCGATGTVFKFIMDYENISFIQAVKKVADIGGIKISISSNDSFKKQAHSTLNDIYDLSLKLYINNLNTAQGIEAKKYLYQRDINDEIIKEFQIGLALRKNTLSSIFSKKFNEKELLSSGLIGKNEKGYYDLFYDRIMFPLYDLSGNVVAYSGRIYNRKDNSKYFNTRETEIFKKGELLYNYHRAKDIARRKNQVIIMEGFMDVIRAYAVDIKNVVATMGTAVTPNQAHLIKKMAKEIILCFDGDEAGEKATMSCASELMKIGVTPKIVRLTDDMDPDEYIRKYGKEAFSRQINNPINVMDFKLNYLKKNKDLTSSIDQAKYIKDVIEELNKIDDDILKELTIKKVCAEMNIDEELIRKHLDAKIEKPLAVETKITYNDKYEKAESALIYYMLKSPEVIAMYDKKITYISNEEYRMIAREISTFYKNFGFITEADFIDYTECDSEIMKTLSKVNKENNKDSYTIDEIEDYINVINDYTVKQEVNRLADKMRQLSDPLEKAKIAEKIVELKKGV